MKIGLLEILQIVFLILKLCNVISWSWFWVLTPTWLLLVLLVAYFIIILKR